MNAKLRKLVKITATGLFLIALAINVKVTLEDPFSMVSEKAMAETTSLPWTPPEEENYDLDWQSSYPECAENLWITSVTKRYFDASLAPSGSVSIRLVSVSYSGGHATYHCEETLTQKIKTRQKICVSGLGACFSNDLNCSQR